MSDISYVVKQYGFYRLQLDVGVVARRLSKCLKQQLRHIVQPPSEQDRQLDRLANTVSFYRRAVGEDIK